MSSKNLSRDKQERAEGGGCLSSIKETSKRLGVSPFTVRRLIGSGALKAVRIARRVMIPQSAIEHAIQHGCEK